MISIKFSGGGDIVAVELIDVQSGTVITKTDRGSQLKGVVFGSVLLGGVGALIGGLTAKTVSQAGGVAYTKLRVTVNDLKCPIYQFSLGGEKNIHWHGVITILMQRSREGSKPEQSKINKVDEVSRDSEAQRLLDGWKRDGEKLRLEKIERDAQIKFFAEREADLARRKGPHHSEMLGYLNDLFFSENEACYSHNEILSKLSSLLAAGANPNGTGDDELEGMPYLQLALLGIEARGDKLYDFVDLLIRYGADVNCVSPFDGETALEQCDENSFYPNKKIEELLLRSGAIPREARVRRGQSPKDGSSTN